MSFLAKDRSICSPVAGYHLSSYTTTPCRFEFSHDESFRRLQEALNSSHQLVILLFWQDLLLSHPFPWPSRGHPADAQNLIGAQSTIPRAAGTSETRIRCAHTAAHCTHTGCPLVSPRLPTGLTQVAHCTHTGCPHRDYFLSSTCLLRTVCRDQRTTLGLLVPWCDSSVQQARLPLLDRISTKQHGRGAHLPLRFVDSVRHTTRSYRLQQQSSSAI